MCVARVEPVGDAATGLFEDDVLLARGPITAQSPLVEAQILDCSHPFAACVTEVRLRREQVVPVSLGLHPDRLDGYEVAPEAQQLLDHPFGVLVASLPEVVVANHALAVDEVERGPV